MPSGSRPHKAIAIIGLSSSQIRERILFVYCNMVANLHSC